MPWPEFITIQFQLTNEVTTDKSEYYGPFNALLNDLFPVSEYYQVAPQFKRIAGSVDFIDVYLITRQKIPIFFIDVKPLLAYDSVSSRKAAAGFSTLLRQVSPSSSTE